MPATHRPEAAPLSRGRQVGFVLITLLAFVLDVFTIVPRADEVGGERWGVLGWEPSFLEIVPLLAAGYAVLFLRRRWPLPVLVWICALSLSFTFWSVATLPVVGILATLYSVAAVSSRLWQAWLALALALVSLCVGFARLEAVTGFDFWIGLLLLVGMSGSLWLFGRRDRNASLAAAGLPDQLAEHGERTAALERRRIARELHDIVAHSVSAMMMQAAGAKAITTALRQDVPDDPRLDTVARALATIENTGSESMRELHRLLSVLRGGEADGLADTESSSQPGMADIAPLVELSRQSGLVVEVHTAGLAVRLDPSVGLAAYRVVQESLTNAMKHSGRGAMVDVFQSWQPDGLQLQVRCRSGHEGTPPGSMGGGSGLFGLHERVDLIGGTFDSGWVGDEFVVTAVLPLTPAERPAPGRTDVASLPAAELHGRHGSRLDATRPQAPGDGLPPGTELMARAHLDDDRAGGAWIHTRQTS